MNQYTALRERQQAEFNAFPCFFAFTDEQFAEGMQRLGLDPAAKDQVCSGPAGMIIRKSDVPALRDMLARHDAEHRAAIEGDTTGTGYTYDMFRYEMSNHEYGYTGEPEDTLTACGLTWEEVEASERLRTAWDRAERRIFGA